MRVLSDATGTGPAAGVVVDTIELADADVRDALAAGVSVEEAVKLLVCKALTVERLAAYVSDGG